MCHIFWKTGIYLLSNNAPLKLNLDLLWKYVYLSCFSYLGAWRSSSRYCPPPETGAPLNNHTIFAKPVIGPWASAFYKLLKPALPSQYSQHRYPQIIMILAWPATYGFPLNLLAGNGWINWWNLIGILHRRQDPAVFHLQCNFTASVTLSTKGLKYLTNVE